MGWTGGRGLHELVDAASCVKNVTKRQPTLLLQSVKDSFTLEIEVKQRQMSPLIHQPVNKAMQVNNAVEDVGGVARQRPLTKAVGTHPGLASWNGSGLNASEADLQPNSLVTCCLRLC